MQIANKSSIDCVYRVSRCISKLQKEKTKQIYVRFAMDSFESGQSQLTGYLDFRQLEHPFASTFAILTNDSDFGNLDLSIDSIMFGSILTHSPIRPQSINENK